MHGVGVMTMVVVVMHWPCTRIGKQCGKSEWRVVNGVGEWPLSDVNSAFMNHIFPYITRLQSQLKYPY